MNEASIQGEICVAYLREEHESLGSAFTIKNPVFVEIEGRKMLRGLCCVADPEHWAYGLRCCVAWDQILGVYEFDTEDDWQRRKPKGKRKRRRRK